MYISYIYIYIYTYICTPQRAAAAAAAAVVTLPSGLDSQNGLSQQTLDPRAPLWSNSTA